MGDGNAAGGLGDSRVEPLQDALSDQPVSFAMIFGSIVTGDASPGSDIDVAVELDAARPGDDGYSDVFLGVYAAITDAVPVDVDLVDVHTMSPEFASVAFENGTVVVGSETRRAALEEKLASKPSLESARERVAAAARRLREGA